MHLSCASQVMNAHCFHKLCIFDLNSERMNSFYHDYCCLKKTHMIKTHVQVEEYYFNLAGSHCGKCQLAPIKGLGSVEIIEPWPKSVLGITRALG